MAIPLRIESKAYDLEASPNERAAAPATWSWGRIVGFRFLCLYMFLYSFPFPFERLPFDNPVESALEVPGRLLAVWTGKYLLHSTARISTDYNGSGDKIYDYVHLLDVLLIAVAGTIVWSIADRRRTQYTKLYAWVRVYARYFLASAIIPYGILKWIPWQFVPPRPEVLLQTFGESSPMRLLWTFMGFSRGYTVFVGSLEIVAPILLFFRRTTTLGALLAATVMLNVVVLNFCYDVPVKIYSSHLLGFAIFLAAADVKRLADVLIFNRTCGPADIELPVHLSPRWWRAKQAVKAAYIAILLLVYVVHYWGRYTREREGAPRPPLYGIYEVTAFARNGTTIPPLLTETTRWRWIAERRGSLTIRTMNDAVEAYETENEDRDHAITIFKKTEPMRKYEVAFTRSGDDQLVFRVTLNGEDIVATARKVDQSKFVLLSRGFRWHNEAPFNN